MNNVRTVQPVTELAIQLTERCNLACTYCYEGVHDKHAPVTDIATAEKAIEWFLQNASGEKKDLTILFWGGEPLLAIDQIEKLLTYAKAEAKTLGKSVKFAATTNGTILSDRTLEILEAGPVHLMVSFDGPKNTHDRHRIYPNGLGSFGVIRKRIPRLLEVFPETAAKITFTGDTVSELSESLVDLAAMGFRTITFAPVMTTLNNGSQFQELETQLSHLSDFWIEALKSDNGLRILPFEWNLRKYLSGHCPPCGAGKQLIGVGTDGTIYPCQRFMGDKEIRDDFVLGNIFDDTYDPGWFAMRQSRHRNSDRPDSDPRKPWWTNDACPACDAKCSKQNVSVIDSRREYNRIIMSVSASIHERMKERLNLNYKEFVLLVSGPVDGAI